MSVCQIWVAASSDPFLVLHISQLDSFLLRGRWRRLIMTSNHELIDHHSRNSPKERSNDWNPPPLLTSPGKQKESAQGKNCSLSIGIFVFGSGTMQDLVISNHHHWLAKDNSTCMSTAISKSDIAPHCKFRWPATQNSYFQDFQDCLSTKEGEK